MKTQLEEKTVVETRLEQMEATATAGMRQPPSGNSLGAVCKDSPIKP